MAVNHTLSAQRCPVTWCDQGSRPHLRHEVTAGTWRGVSFTPPRRPMDTQLVVHGMSDTEAAPMLVLVDRLEQTDVVLTWEQFTDLVDHGQDLISRFTRPHER